MQGLALGRENVERTRQMYMVIAFGRKRLHQHRLLRVIEFLLKFVACDFRNHRVRLSSRRAA